MKLTEALKKSGMTAIIYGESGMGKTHLLGTLPGKTLIIAAEASGIVCLRRSANVDHIEVRFLPENAKELEQFFEALKLETLPYDNICLDSATALSNTILQQRTDVTKNGGCATQHNYNELKSAFERYMITLCQLAVNKGKNVILTALEGMLELNKNSESAVAKSYPLAGTSKFPPQFCGMVDIVAHLERTADGVRFLRMVPTETTVGKDRIYNRSGCLADGALLLSGKTGREEEENNKK